MKINTLTKRYAISLAFTCGLLMNSGLASAATVTCNNTADPTDREFTLTTSTVATCFDSGSGANDVNGDPAQDVIFAQGYQVIDKDPDSGDPLDSKGLFTDALDIIGAGTTSGTFSFVAPAGFINFIIAFKSGGGGIDPSWVAFALIDGITSGSWSISGSQSLSHATLYAQVDPNGNNPVVPLPAALPLLLGALGGLGFLARFRKAGAAA